YDSWPKPAQGAACVRRPAGEAPPTMGGCAVDEILHCIDLRQRGECGQLQAIAPGDDGRGCEGVIQQTSLRHPWLDRSRTGDIEIAESWNRSVDFGQRTGQACAEVGSI